MMGMSILAVVCLDPVVAGNGQKHICRSQEPFCLFLSPPYISLLRISRVYEEITEPEKPAEKPAATDKPAEEKKPRHRPAKPFTGVVPDGKVVVPDFTGKSLREAAGLAADKGLSFQSEGSGYAVGQSIELNTLVDKGTTITVYFEPG